MKPWIDVGRRPWARPDLRRIMSVFTIWALFIFLSVTAEHPEFWSHKEEVNPHQDYIGHGGGNRVYHHRRQSKMVKQPYYPLKSIDALRLWGQKLSTPVEPLESKSSPRRQPRPISLKNSTASPNPKTNRLGLSLHHATLPTLPLEDDALNKVSHTYWPEGVVTSVLSRSIVVSYADNVTEIINSVVIQGDFGEDITASINKTTEYLFEFLYNTSSLNKNAVRVTVSSPDSDYTNPLLVVVRQQRGVLSWQLPLEPPSNSNIPEEYRTVARTLCPVKNYKVSLRGSLDTKQRLFVDVSTSSPKNITFTVNVDFEENFHMELHTVQSFQITPSQPVFYEFVFPDKVNMVLVKANAEDDFCAMVAIQNITLDKSD